MRAAERSRIEERSIPLITIHPPLVTIRGPDRNMGGYHRVIWADTNEHHCAMKTTISRSLLLLATVFTLGYTNAAEPVRMNTATKKSALERSLDRALNNTLAFPLLAKEDMTGEVFVSFVINKEGRVEVIDCSSSNAHLKAYVLRKLARIDIGENPDGSWKTTRMVFNFRPEKV